MNSITSLIVWCLVDMIATATLWSGTIGNYFTLSLTNAYIIAGVATFCGICTLLTAFNLFSASKK